MVLFFVFFYTGALAQGQPNIRWLVPGHDGVSRVAYSPDGSKVASAGSDGTIKIWNAQTGTFLRTIAGQKMSFSSIVFSPDGLSVACATGIFEPVIEFIVTIWSVQTGIMIRRTVGGHAGGITSIAISPDGQTLASGSIDATAKLWSASTGALIYTLPGLSNTVYSVAFSPDGNTLVAGGGDGRIKFWNVQTGTLNFFVSEQTIRSLAVSPNGLVLATYSENTGLRLRSMQTGTLIWTRAEAFRSAIAFSPDGQTVFLTGANGVYQYSAGSGALLRSAYVNGAVDITSIALSPDGQTYITNGGNLYQFGLLSLTPIRSYCVNTGRINGVVYSKDGSLIATAISPHSIKVWNSETSSVAQLIPNVGQSSIDTVEDVAISPDGNSIAATSDRLEVFNRLSGVKLWSYPISYGRVNFSPNGQMLACTSSSGFDVRLFDATTGTLVQTLSGHTLTVTSAVFDPDGSNLYTASFDNTIRRWDLSTGQTTRIFMGHSSSVTRIALSSDGLTLVSGSADQTLKVWNTTTGALLRTLTGNSGYIRSLALSADGLRIYSTCGDLDNRVSVWSVATGVLLRYFDGETGSPSGLVASSPDGTSVALARADATLMVFRDPFASLKGVVNLTDFIGDITGQTFSFTLKNSAGTMVDSWTQSLDATGHFTHPPSSALEDISYFLTAKGPHWLSMTISFAPAAIQDLSLTPTNGDSTGDNVIDLSDYTVLILAFNALPTSGNWDERADLNGDNAIDLTDYTILVTNFNMVGD